MSEKTKKKRSFLFKFVLVLFIIATILFLFFALINGSPKTFSSVNKENSFIKEGKTPLVIPHGGAKLLAPENTIYAYDMLVNDFNADVLEIDLAITKDGILVSHHDLELEMSPESALNDKFIRDYNYQEIIDEYIVDDYYLARNFTDINGNKPFAKGGSLDTTENMERMIPAKIEDIFKNVGNGVLYILEIKDSPTSNGYEEGSKLYEKASQTLIDLVVEYKLDSNVVLASFSDEVTAYFRANAPQMMINAGVKEVTNFAIFSAFHIDFFWNVNSEVLILPNPESMSITGSTAKILDLLPGFLRDSIAVKDSSGVYRANLMHTQIINDAHRKNMAVLYWTVNDKEEMRLLINNGADGIITDRPDILIELLEEMGLNK